MFRRRDEDETEFTLQSPNKNSNNSGIPAATNNQGSNMTTNSSSNDETQASAVPFVKTSQTAASAAPAAEAPAKAEKIEPTTSKEAKNPNPKPSSVNTFVPSALRASSSPTNNTQTPAYSAPAASAAQSPSFPAKPLKIDNIGLETERRLTVGYGISLEGKVSDCDKLVIYGTVNAELNNVKALQISDSGCFRGAAEIDYAEIAGLFEGELRVRKSIVINSTGRVSGKITYGSIEIKPGGKFTGEIVEDKALSETVQSPARSGDELGLFGESKTDKAA